MDSRPANPLKAWLRTNKMRVGELSRRLQRGEGTVTRWCTGTRHPGPIDQENIRRATKNAVRPSDWHEYRVAFLRSEAA